MIKLILIYIALCVLLSFIGTNLGECTRAQSFIIKFLCYFILTPLFGWVIVWFLNLPVDDSFDREVLKEIQEELNE
ncbi:MAG TPA: hypothetical protein PK978_06855 [Paludibacter sp.]|mgnify:CR=1 FL=1|nr:hypothetical protein [Paludibacter sp.]